MIAQKMRSSELSGEQKSPCQLAPDQCPHLSLGGPVTLRHVLLQKQFGITVDASELW